jgi:hypothetical protein
MSIHDRLNQHVDFINNYRLTYRDHIIRFNKLIKIKLSEEFPELFEHYGYDLNQYVQIVDCNDKNKIICGGTITPKETFINYQGRQNTFDGSINYNNCETEYYHECTNPVLEHYINDCIKYEHKNKKITVIFSTIYGVVEFKEFDSCYTILSKDIKLILIISKNNIEKIFQSCQ